MIPFRFKLYILLLLPFVILGGIFDLSLHRVVKGYEQALEADRLTEFEELQNRLHLMVRQLESTATSLSRPWEIRYAVEAADNEVLHDWGSSFMGPVDSVLFTNSGGVVLARAPDEYLFGDDLSEAPLFRQVMEQGFYSGVVTLDGMVQIVAARRVDKYGDMSLGMVCVGLEFTPELLAGLSHSKDMIVTYVGDAGVIEPLNHGPEGEFLRRTEFAIADNGFETNGHFEVKFLEDESHGRLQALVRRLSLSGVAVMVLVLLGFFWALRRQFAPYRVIVRSVLDYSRGNQDLPDLRRRLAGVQSKPVREVTLIADALIHMVDTIASNFRSIEEYNVQLQEMANKDPLTRLYNRRFMDKALISEVKRARRYGTPLSVVLMDVDFFKNINDKFGHLVGDMVLSELAKLMQENSRDSDVIARWGGEEFLVSCPGVALADASAYAEKLRQLIEENGFPEQVRVTASFGVAQYEPDERMESLLVRADDRLYKAKELGRNKVCS